MSAPATPPPDNRTGGSAPGRASAIARTRGLGFYCVDNLRWRWPQRLALAAAAISGAPRRVALGIDDVSVSLSALAKIFASLKRAGSGPSHILRAADEAVLTRRYRKKRADASMAQKGATVAERHPDGARSRCRTKFRGKSESLIDTRR